VYSVWDVPWGLGAIRNAGEKGCKEEFGKDGWTMRNVKKFDVVLELMIDLYPEMRFSYVHNTVMLKQ
jgi:hypothetical protein